MSARHGLKEKNIKTRETSKPVGTQDPQNAIILVLGAGQTTKTQDGTHAILGNVKTVIKVKRINRNDVRQSSTSKIFSHFPVNLMLNTVWFKKTRLISKQLDFGVLYQPSGAGGTRSPPATPHRLQRRTACNTSPPALSKMADGVPI